MYKEFKNDEHLRRQRMQEAEHYRLVRQTELSPKTQPTRPRMMKLVLLMMTRIVNVITGS